LVYSTMTRGDVATNKEQLFVTPPKG